MGSPIKLYKRNLSKALSIMVISFFLLPKNNMRSFQKYSLCFYGSKTHTIDICPPQRVSRDFIPSIYRYKPGRYPASISATLGYFYMAGYLQCTFGHFSNRHQDSHIGCYPKDFRRFRHIPDYNSPGNPRQKNQETSYLPISPCTNSCGLFQIR